MNLNKAFDMFFKTQKELGQKKYSSQAAFGKALIQILGIPTDYSDGFLRDVTSGKRAVPIPKNYVLTEETKRKLVGLLTSCFETDEITLVDSKFGIAANTKINIHALAEALIAVFEEDLLGLNAGSVSDHYFALLSGRSNLNAEATVEPNKNRIYPGDGIANDILKAKISMGFHEAYIYTWILRNTGSVQWTERTLVRINPELKKVRNTPEIIPIPDLSPGASVQLQSKFNSRNHEGEFLTKWEVRDKNGQNCFPNASNILDVTIKIGFTD